MTGYSYALRLSRHAQSRQAVHSVSEWLQKSMQFSEAS
ncbi:hypothetical protein PAUR_b0616 [Pseudoalteromonas aurantia 208]|uniref:LysR family transcriptional regulator n=1 Tax=Pseudoalteromonas aurantia 208 TaxID=1314867 RepID=A0ABR9EHZ7_9GAMM|nr:hypothetical protein [Pseudoalteromonas aurantia 208]